MSIHSHIRIHIYVCVCVCEYMFNLIEKRDHFALLTEKYCNLISLLFVVIVVIIIIKNI
jgi:hypothetical protein